MVSQPVHEHLRKTSSMVALYNILVTYVYQKLKDYIVLQWASIQVLILGYRVKEEDGH